MKKLFIVSKTFLALALIAGNLTSCKESDNQKDTKEVAEDTNDARLEDSPQEDASTFFVEIAEMELAEIEVAKLVEKRATNVEVKKFASMLVVAHTKSTLELQELATERQIALPTSLTDEGKEEFEKLNEKTGSDFDKKFINEVIEDHKKAIDKMEDASKNNDYEESIKGWSSTKIATLTSHLQEAKMLKEKLDRK